MDALFLRALLEAARESTPSLEPGTIVTLSPNFYQYEDAARGPLSPGEVGIILQNDRSGKPYHVATPSGRTWWYCKDAIVAAQGAGASAEDPNAISHRAHPHRLKSCQMGSGWSCDVCGQAGHQVHFRCTSGCNWDICGECINQHGHRGEWRGREKSQWCSIPGKVEGCLCRHGQGILQREHWSCCARNMMESGCITVSVNGGGGGGGGSRFNVGDDVMLAPGYEGCQDAADGPLRPGEVGSVLQDDGSSKPYLVRAANGNRWWYIASALQRASGGGGGMRAIGGGDADTFTHPQHPHRLRTHGGSYNCDVCRASDPPGRHRCVSGCDWDACRRCMSEAGHRGEWRDPTSPERKKYCSLPGDTDGRVCEHASGIVKSTHWSCCGSTLMVGRGCVSAAVSAAQTRAAAPPPPPAPPAAPAGGQQPASNGGGKAVFDPVTGKITFG